MISNPKIQLTKRESDIMNILWDVSKPLVASEIVKYDSTLSISTVQTVLKKLVAKKLIEVADIIYSGKVLTRSYHYIVSKKDYEKQAVSDSILTLTQNNVSFSTFATAFFNSEKDSEKALEELKNLEKIIQEQKKLLQRER